MTSQPRATVAYLVATLGARTRIATAIEQLDLAAIPVTRRDLVDGAHRRHAHVAFVYDLSPWDETAVHLLTIVKDRCPELPVLLYPPARPLTGRLLVECGKRPLVWALLDADGVGTPTQLRQALREMLAGSSAGVILERVRQSVESLGVQADRFCRLTVQRLVSGDAARRATVTAISSELGVTRRGLERAFKRQRVMPPKELFDWMVMLVTADLAVRRGERSRFYHLATNLGLESARVRSARHRLWDRGLKTSKNAINWPPDRFFENVLAAFIRRCHDVRLEIREMAPPRRRRTPTSAT